MASTLLLLKLKVFVLPWRLCPFSVCHCGSPHGDHPHAGFGFTAEMGRLGSSKWSSEKREMSTSSTCSLISSVFPPFQGTSRVIKNSYLVYVGQDSGLFVGKSKHTRDPTQCPGGRQCTTTGMIHPSLTLLERTFSRRVLIPAWTFTWFQSYLLKVTKKKNSALTDLPPPTLENGILWEKH